MQLDLTIMEALLIKFKNPEINNKEEGSIKILQIF
jgi:hypothetical protein